MDAILRVLEVFFSVFTQKSQLLGAEMLGMVKLLIGRLLIAAAALIFLCIGLSMVLIKLAADLQQEYLIGALVSGVSLIVFLVALLSGLSKTKKLKRDPKTPSPLEEALAILIKDYVEERKLKRQQTTPTHPISE